MKRRVTGEGEKLKTKGNNFFRKGKLERALDCYSKSLDSPNLPKKTKIDVLSNMAAVFNRQKKWEQSFSTCKKLFVLTEHRSHVKSFCRCFEACVKSREFEKLRYTKILFATSNHLPKKECKQLFSFAYKFLQKEEKNVVINEKTKKDLRMNLKDIILHFLDGKKEGNGKWLTWEDSSLSKFSSDDEECFGEENYYESIRRIKEICDSEPNSSKYFLDIFKEVEDPGVRKHHDENFESEFGHMLDGDVFLIVHLAKKFSEKIDNNDPIQYHWSSLSYIIQTLKHLSKKKLYVDLIDRLFHKHLDSCSNKQHDTEHMDMCRLWIKGRRLEMIPIIRRCFMKDIVDLNYFGGWNLVLNEFGLHPTNERDEKLNTRTEIIREGRRIWRCRSMGIGMRGMPGMDDIYKRAFSRHTVKCTFFYCSNLSLDMEFKFKCSKCRVRYCSQVCLMRDNHSGICHLMTLPKEEEEIPEEVDDGKLKVCVNCFAKEKKRGEFKKCARCRKVWYCGIFCQKYDWDFGVHKKECKKKKK